MNFNNSIHDLTSLNSFSYIHNNNGNYITGKKFNKIIKTSNPDELLCSSPKSDFKNKYYAICKKSHDYRIKNLYYLNENNLYNLLACVSSAHININYQLQFHVSSIENLLKQLTYFTHNRLLSYIDNTIYKDFKYSLQSKSYLIINIDNKKIKKISNNDLHIIVKKLLTKAEQPAEIKYLSDTITCLEKRNKLPNNQLTFYQQTIIKKIMFGVKYYLTYHKKNSCYNPQEIIYKLHSLICLVQEKNISLQTKLKEKLVKEIMFLFNEFIRNINFDIPDLPTTNKQYLNINNFINDVVIVLIEFLAKNPTKFLTDIKAKQLKLINKANSILTRLDHSVASLSYYCNAINTSIVNLSNIITDSIKQKLENDQQNEIVSQDNQNDDAISISSLIKKKSLLTATKDQQHINLSLLQDTHNLKKEVKHALEIFKAYKQEHGIFQKYFSYYKDSINSKQLESYQKIVRQSLFDYVSKKLVDDIKYKIRVSEIKTTIDNMLTSQLNLSKKIIVIATIYCAIDSLREETIIPNIDIFINKTIEVQQHTIAKNMLNENTIYDIHLVNENAYF